MTQPENEHNRRLKVEKIRRLINQIHDRRVRNYAREEERIAAHQNRLVQMGEEPEPLNSPDFDDPSMLSTYMFQGLDT